ncbi:hypothetical protein BJ944DRAFT_263919 [Cunninghamella echinulata]|nr:hypothetical protein BJ944DRAFT_263919 [Cunninghamella echinulata]
MTTEPDALLYQCKICLEKDDLTCLISPCKCTGSIKYVHPQCMNSWRKSLQQRGREKDIYICTLCQQGLLIKQLHPYRAVLNYKIIRGLCTIAILMLALIPIGWLMKVIIQFSAYITKDPNGGLIEAWKNKQFASFLFSTIQKSIVSSIFPSTIPPNHVNYSPFSICYMDQHHQLSSISTSLSLSSIHLEGYMPFYHSILSNQTLYILFFPFSDERLWQFLLCRCQHLHLGFFLLGSVANVWYTYQILYDMFDIVFMGEEENEMDQFIMQDEPVTNNVENEENQHPQRPSFLSILTRKIGTIAKGFLVSYCCMLVILFWIHFNLFAFVEPNPSSSFSSTSSTSLSTSVLTTASSISSSSTLTSPPLLNKFTPLSKIENLDSSFSTSSSSSSPVELLLQQQLISIKNQFITELPLWTLRWVTLGVAVISVMVKVIYPWISQLTSCIDQEIVLSVPEHQH